MVDGRKSLIGYQGKEGGDYYYGMLAEDTRKAWCTANLSRQCFYDTR